MKRGWTGLLEHRRLAKARRWVASLLRLADERRSPDARFRLQLMVGVVILLVAAWLFGEVAEDVVARALLTVADEWLAAWLNQHATPGFTPAMLLKAIRSTTSRCCSNPPRIEAVLKAVPCHGPAR